MFWGFHIYLHEHICDCYSQQECRSKLPSLQLLKLSPKTARRRKWQPTPVLLPREFCGWQSLVGFCPWGRRELDTTEQLHFPFSLSFTGEGNGNPLQCSCLKNPMDRGAWWAAVPGVAEGRTRLSDFTFTFTHWRRKWQPTPVFLPGESQGRGSLVGCRLWGRTEPDTTEATQQQQLQDRTQSPLKPYMAMSLRRPRMHGRSVRGEWLGPQCQAREFI